MQNNSEQSWNSYLNTELAILEPILVKQGYTLNEHQPHTEGERFLMQNITTSGGKKMILLGKHEDGTDVVIKATRESAGKEEIAHERKCRQALSNINFSYLDFHAPIERDHLSEAGFYISIQNFIPQDKTFLNRSLEEQFNFALQAFKIQEGARATTATHYKNIAGIFGIRNSLDYKKLVDGFIETLKSSNVSADILVTTTTTQTIIHNQLERIEQYCGFITHTDFVPHNFRIVDDTLYLLDFSSLQLGNKHESWARFLNFMTLYNRDLESLLVKYMIDNRAPEEIESLKLMRLFRLIEIITYYVKTLPNSSDDLLELNKARVKFWHEVLQAEIQDTRVSEEIVNKYKSVRDSLRSESEKRRQINLH